jgi:hypothetical protein
VTEESGTGRRTSCEAMASTTGRETCVEGERASEDEIEMEGVG